MIRQAAHFFLGTLISRFGGLLRELSMASCFGASALVGDFFTSYRWSNIFRRLLGEGGVSNGFIPVYEKYRLAEGVKADLFFRDLFWTLLLTLIPVISVIVAIFFGTVASYMLPGVIFIVLYALFMAYLQCHGYYFLPSVAPIIFNLIWVGGCYFFVSYPEAKALKGIAGCISIAFFFQWVVLIPKTVQCLNIGLKEWFVLRPFSFEVKELLKPLFLTLMGVAAMQLNGAIDLIFAKWADPSGAAFLSYAIKWEQLPMALFGVAVSQAIAPLLARAYQNKNYAEYHHLTQKSLRLTLKLLAPFTLLFIVAAPPVMSLVYGRGAFLDQDITMTAQALCLYTVGLIPSGLILLLAPSFYAAQDFKTPMQATLLAVGINVALNGLIVVLGMGASMIALTTSISFWVQWAFLASRLKTSYPFRSLISHIMLVTGISLLSYFLFPDLYWRIQYPTSIFDKIWQILEVVTIPFALYGIGAYWFKEAPLVAPINPSVPPVGENGVDEKKLTQEF